jgi:hypothetical protein
MCVCVCVCVCVYIYIYIYIYLPLHEKLHAAAVCDKEVSLVMAE